MNPSQLKAHLWVRAQAEAAALASELDTALPGLRTLWAHNQHEAAAILQFAARLRPLHLERSQFPHLTSLRSLIGQAHNRAHR